MAPGRRRVGVALLLDDPARTEVQGLRRALGDPSLGRIDPHLTLVPPVNIRAGDLGAALARLRAAAAAQAGPLVLTLGPPATFMPDNPVAYLAVGGDLERLRSLRDSVFAPPLERKLSWPWVPHVTLADGIEESRIEAALPAMDRYAAAATVDRVVLLEERSGRVWLPLADAALGPAAVVGTGGIALTVVRGTVPDPQLLAAASAEGVDLAGGAGGPGSGSFRDGPVVLTAYREGRPAGTAAAWVAPQGPRAAVWVAPPDRGQGVGTHLLAQLESAARDSGWEFPSVTGVGAPGFYDSRSAWIREPVTRTRPPRTGRAS